MADYSGKQITHVQELISAVTDFLGAYDRLQSLVLKEQNSGYGDSNLPRYISNEILAASPDTKHLSAADLANVYGSIASQTIKDYFSVHRTNYEAIKKD